MRPKRLGVAALLVVGLAWPSQARAQDGCEWLAPSGNLRTDQIGASSITRVATPHLLCSGGTRIRADSAVMFPATSFYQLFGNVYFENPESVLRSKDAQYYRQRRQLNAQGDVRVTRKVDGAVITGGNLEYLEEGPDRPGSLVTVTGRMSDGARAHARLVVQPDTSPPREPVVAPPLVAPSAAGDTTAAADTAAADTAITHMAVSDTAVEAGGVPDTVTAPTPAPDRRPAPRDTTPIVYDVDADRIVLSGEDAFTATGDAEIERDSLRAFGDTASFTGEEGVLRLDGSARLVGASYELAGRHIRAALPGREIREVVSRERAVLTGESLRLAAPEIHLFLEEGALERLVAVGDSTAGAGGAEDQDGPPAVPGEAAPVTPGARTTPGEPGTPDIFAVEHPDRPVARAQDFFLVADSVEVLSPGQVLERLVAVGSARGESAARDSLNTESTPAVARRDWIDGDTVIATFVPAETPGRAPPTPDADTARAEYRLERLVARVGARTLYRMAASDTAAGAEAAGATQGEGEAAGGGELEQDVDTAAVALDPAPRPHPPMAIHFVMGDEITIILKDGEVERMEVVGQTQGVHLEPGTAASRGARRQEP